MVSFLRLFPRKIHLDIWRTATIVFTKQFDHFYAQTDLFQPFRLDISGSGNFSKSRSRSNEAFSSVHLWGVGTFVLTTMETFQTWFHVKIRSFYRWRPFTKKFDHFCDNIHSQTLSNGAVTTMFSRKLVWTGVWTSLETFHNPSHTLTVVKRCTHFIFKDSEPFFL